MDSEGPGPARSRPCRGPGPRLPPRPWGRGGGGLHRQRAGRDRARTTARRASRGRPGRGTGPGGGADLPPDRALVARLGGRLRLGGRPSRRVALPRRPAGDAGRSRPRRRPRPPRASGALAVARPEGGGGNIALGMMRTLILALAASFALAAGSPTESLWW